MPCRAVWSYSWHNRNSKTNWSISWPLALAGPGLALGSHFMWSSAFNAIIVPLFEFYFRLGGWRHAGTEQPGELLLLRWISPSYRAMHRNKHPQPTHLLESHERMTAEQRRYLGALFACLLLCLTFVDLPPCSIFASHLTNDAVICWLVTRILHN